MAQTPSSASTPADLGGAEAIRAITALTKRDHVSVEFRPLPEKAIGLGSYVAEPHVAIIRQGDRVEIQSLSAAIAETRGKPFARKGTAQAETLASFISLVDRHKRPEESVVFANTDWRKPSLTAILDYHHQATDDDQKLNKFEDAGARFGRHRIHYAYPLSEAWQEWVKGNKVPMQQADFAAFLEDHIVDLASPTDAERIQFEADFKAKFATPSELIDLSRGLEVLVGARVKNRTRLQSGETQMVFEVEHTDAEGNELTVPGLFLLSIAPFHRGETIRIPCRLRYRTGGAAIIWFYEMIQPDRFIDERLIDDAHNVSVETGLPVFAGAPEMSGS